MFLVGLTGGIATGKSSISKLFRDNGIPVIDADLIARQGMQINGWLYQWHNSIKFYTYKYIDAYRQ